MAGALPIWNTDSFLELFARWYFPGYEPGWVACEGVTTRTLVRRGRAAPGTWHFPRELAPADPPPEIRPTLVPFLQSVAVRTCKVTECEELSGTVSLHVDWRSFHSWDDFQAYSGSRGASFHSLPAYERNLERRAGRLRFSPSDSAPLVLDKLLGWKTEQVQARHDQNRLAVERNRRFLHALMDEGLAQCATLSAGEQLLAGGLCLRSGSRLTFVLTAFDPAYSRFSPGAGLLRRLLRYSYEAGDQQFDFMGGCESYKLQYATHVRHRVDLGVEPRFDRMRRTARMRIGDALHGHPQLQRAARKTESALRSALTGSR